MRVFVIVLTIGLSNNDIANSIHVGRSPEEVKFKLAEALRSEIENDDFGRYQHLSATGIGGRELSDDEIIEIWFENNEDEAWEMFAEEI